jgi:hypothetical protein
VRDSVHKDFRCPECKTLNRIGFDLELGMYGFKIEGSPYSSSKTTQCGNCKEPFKCELSLEVTTNKLNDMQKKWYFLQQEKRLNRT